jgi:hypothetical protein
LAAAIDGKNLYAAHEFLTNRRPKYMKRTKKKQWTRKFDTDAAQNKNLPIPTQIISNEEFMPPEQTREQQLVEHRLIALAELGAKRLNISRRQFLATTGGSQEETEVFAWVALYRKLNGQWKLTAVASTRTPEQETAEAQPSKTQ